MSSDRLASCPSVVGGGACRSAGCEVTASPLCCWFASMVLLCPEATRWWRQSGDGRTLKAGFCDTDHRRYSSTDQSINRRSDAEPQNRKLLEHKADADGIHQYSSLVIWRRIRLIKFGLLLISGCMFVYIYIHVGLCIYVKIYKYILYVCVYIHLILITERLRVSEGGGVFVPTDQSIVYCETINQLQIYKPAASVPGALWTPKRCCHYCLVATFSTAHERCLTW